MRPPTIFLDFDGVLNSIRSLLATGRGGARSPDPMAVGLVERLAVNAGAQVVISSSWRVGSSVPDLQRTLIRWQGRALAERVIDVTPRLGGQRGAEIARWLAQHPNLHDGNYVIIDDDADMLDGQLSRFVQTRHRDGFGVVEYLRALEIIAPDHHDVTSLAWYRDDRPLSSEIRRRLAWED